MTPWVTEEIVFYALAFWGTVATSLRNILNRRVSFHIAGTILTMRLDRQCVDKNGIFEIPKNNDKNPSIEFITTMSKSPTTKRTTAQSPTTKPTTAQSPTTKTTTAQSPTPTTTTAKSPTTTTTTITAKSPTTAQSPTTRPTTAQSPTTKPTTAKSPTPTTTTAKTPTTTTTTITSPKPLYEKVGFLVGEETPVWIATVSPETWSSHTSYNFKRVRPNESPSVIRRALNYWDSLKKGSGFPFRTKRSIDDRGNLTYKEQFYDALTSAAINRFDSPSLVEKRSADSNDVVYPSVLVVMDYATTRTLEEQVLYALAFWGTIDSTMRRNIQNPRVSLRIVGIVITASREVTPYLATSQYGYSFNLAMEPMLSYWKSVSERRNSDLPIGSYDIVAHMTDIFPNGDRVLWSQMFQSRHKRKRANDFFGGVASQTLPCKYTNQIGAVVFRDNFNFDGIYRAVAYMSKVLGGQAKPPPYYQNFPREWTKNMLDSLSDSLKHASCMSAPKEYYPPGAPIAPILAGELVPNEKQCENAGYNPDAWTCWDTSYNSRRSTCRDLQCSNGRVWGLSCKQVGRPLDGSFCNTENTKICLDGECVDKI